MTRIHRTSAALLALALFAAPQVASAQTASSPAAPARTDQSAPAVRPAPPPAADLSFAASFDCATMGAEPPPADATRMHMEFDRLGQMGAYQRQLIGWYSRRFIDHGAWTSEQATAFARTTFEHPDLASMQLYLRERFAMANQEQVRVAGLVRDRDYPAACRALVTMVGHMAEAPARYRVVWATIDQLYTAEAQRLGVPLP